MVTVPFSELKVGSTYVLPAPSDVDRFTMGTNSQVWINQRTNLLKCVGHPMKVDSRNRDDMITISIRGRGVYGMHTYEAFFPEGQRFKPFVKGVDIIPQDPPPVRPPLPDPSADPWDEFYPKEYYGYEEDESNKTVEHRLMRARVDWMQKEYGRPGFRPKIADVFSSDDLAAQTQFFTSFTPDEKNMINEYLYDSYKYTTPSAAWFLFPSGPEPPPDEDEPLEDDKKSVYKNLLFRAPKLTREIEVFRGLRMGERDIESLKKGTVPISVSYDKYTARDYNAAGKGQCCLLRVIVKPGVRLIAIDFFKFPTNPEKIGKEGDGSDCEILICPPYNVQVEDIGGPTTGLKRVTITPKLSGGRRRTRKHKRRARKTRRRHKKTT
jgi:hypothetical protein